MLSLNRLGEIYYRFTKNTACGAAEFVRQILNPRLVTGFFNI